MYEKMLHTGVCILDQAALKILGCTCKTPELNVFRVNLCRQLRYQCLNFYLNIHVCVL